MTIVAHDGETSAAHHSKDMPARYRVDWMLEDDIASVAAIGGPTRMSEEQLRAEIRRPWARIWVMREDDGVVAYVVAWHVTDELHVLNVATRQDRRRRGIARALMTEVVKYARQQRIGRVLLEVRRSNRAAISLYRGTGFFVIGVRARYYPDGEDALDMNLTLDPATGEIVSHPDEVLLES